MNKLRNLRLSTGYSQERMAHIIGVTFNTYSKIERGAKPSRIFIEKTKQAFPEIDINEMFFSKEA